MEIFIRFYTSIIRYFVTIIHNFKFWIVLRFSKATPILGLFLDDERFPANVYWIQYPISVNWKIVRCYEEFQMEAASGIFSIMSLDHDLGNDTIIDLGDYKRIANGVDCIRHLTSLIQFGIIYDPIVYFHSQNVIGRRNMESLWKSFKESRFNIN